jgi:orotidine-5'-phosphate decarboxylase
MAQTYARRAADHPNRLSRKLFEIAESKRTNIALSADLTTTKELLEITDGMQGASVLEARHPASWLL